MKRYGEILRIPGLIAVVLSQLIARFPGGMLSIGIIIHLQRQTGNFTTPGIVLAAMSFGQAVASPVTSRLMSRYGIRQIIGITLAISTIAMVLLAVVELDPVLAVINGLVLGCTLAPIQPAARAVYPSMVPKGKLQTLQSLDASIQELIWIGGPVIVVTVATQINSAAAILSSALLGLGGGMWFLTRPQVASVTLPPSTGRMGAVLKKPAVIIGVITGLMVVGSFGAIEAATISAFGSESDSIAGIVLALWAATSLIGGLAMGHTPMGPWSLSRRLGVVALGTALAMLTMDPVLITFALLLSGLGVAPAMTVQYAIATESVDKGDIPESLGWLGTGWVMGGAVAAAAAGVAIDAWGTTGGFAVATAFALLAAAIPAIFVQRLPDLRHLSSH